MLSMFSDLANFWFIYDFRDFSSPYMAYIYSENETIPTTQI